LDRAAQINGVPNLAFGPRDAPQVPALQNSFRRRAPVPVGGAGVEHHVFEHRECNRLQVVQPFVNQLAHALLDLRARQQARCLFLRGQFSLYPAARAAAAPLRHVTYA